MSLAIDVGELLAGTYDCAPMLIAAADADGRIILFNQQCERLTGFQRGAILGKSFLHTLVPPDWHDVVTRRFATATDAELAAPHVNPWLTESGEVRNIEWRCCRADMPDGRWIVGFGSDASRITTTVTPDDFVAAVAHELRQPLSACLGAVAMMKIRQNRETGEHARNVLERQLTQMTRLIDDLLDTTHVARGTVALNCIDLDLRDAVRRALESMQLSIGRRNHESSLSVPDKPVIVAADPLRLQQVLSNLLTNAVKYTDPGGTIVVAVTAAGNDARVSVRDNGAGIGKDAHERIFDLFTRATTTGAGFGIGLAVVRRLVEAHGGTVTVASAGIGSGSEFIVTLPRNLAQGQSDSSEPRKRPADEP